MASDDEWDLGALEEMDRLVEAAYSKARAPSLTPPPHARTTPVTFSSTPVRSPCTRPPHPPFPSRTSPSGGGTDD